MIVSAPGKAVLWGEYAALTGAPAAVMALNARAQVHITPSQDALWHFKTSGFESPNTACAPERLPPPSDQNFCATVTTHWGLNCLADLSDRPLNVFTGTDAFYHHKQKLGLGSSAAVCNAVYRALCELSGRMASVTEANEIHRAWQGKRGSGLDVACSWSGGTVILQNGQTQPLSLPEGLQWQLVWSGKSAETVSHIHRFNDWLSRGDIAPLNRLAKCCADLANGHLNLPALAAYIEALRQLDHEAGLNIFTQEHASLGNIASASGALYKPCGAGGGDIGIAFAESEAQIARFAAQAQAHGFQILDLEIAEHGTRVE